MIRNMISWLVLAAVATPLAAQSTTGRPASPAQSVAPSAPVQKPMPRAEFLTSMDAEFKKIDADHDGFITRAEVEAHQRASAFATADARARALFTNLDTDKNGQLSFAEFAKLIAGSQARVNGQPFIARMDTSGDRRVSLIEHRAATLANFDRMDSDKDGVLTPTEMKAAGILK